MSLFSSFIFPSNSFFSWINKSALGLEGVWTGVILSCYFGISFRSLLYWTICWYQSAFQIIHILLCTSLVNLRSIQQSLQSPETSFFFPYQFLFLSHTLFFFLLESFIKFWLSTKVSTFSAVMLFIFYYWHACSHAKKLHRQG